MTKQELVEHIDEFIRTEETASALYLQHLKAIVTRSGRTNTDVERMKKIIGFLMDANKHHQKLLTELGERVRKEPSDVY